MPALICLILLSGMSCIHAQDLNDTSEELNLDADDLELAGTEDDVLSDDCESDASSKAYLVLDNDADKEEINVGDSVTWTVSVLNKGPDTAKNVIVFDQLPDGMKYIKHTATKGTFNPQTGIWDIGNLSVDDGEVFLKILAKALTSGEKINKAKLTSDTINLNDNESYEEEEIDVFEMPETSKSDTVQSARAIMLPTANPIGLIVISVFAILISFKRTDETPPH